MQRWALVAIVLACGASGKAPVAPPFGCEGERCVQRHPRLPDDGEWECADMAGAAICRGGEPPAGVAPAPADPRWRCGSRANGERLCVDLTADFPGGAPAGWRCRYQHAPGVRRSCVRDRDAHNLGDACARQRPCVDGARCEAGRCVAPTGTPSCWLDDDCGRGTCRFGRCRAEGS